MKKTSNRWSLALTVWQFWFNPDCPILQAKSLQESVWVYSDPYPLLINCFIKIYLIILEIILLSKKNYIRSTKMHIKLQIKMPKN